MIGKRLDVTDRDHDGKRRISEVEDEGDCRMVLLLLLSGVLYDRITGWQARHVGG